jgi:hypothetical protein
MSTTVLVEMAITTLPRVTFLNPGFSAATL